LPSYQDLWLVLEYLEQGVQVCAMSEGDEQHDAMVLAAHWLACFHRDLEGPAARGDFGFLKRYDEA
jgi:hypothetical protein